MKHKMNTEKNRKLATYALIPYAIIGIMNVFANHGLLGLIVISSVSIVAVKIFNKYYKQIK